MTGGTHCETKEAITMQGLRQFELMEDLEPGRSAHAALLRWDGRRYVRTTEIVELHEFVGIHGSKGDRGFGFLSPDSGHWEAACGLYQQVPQWAHP
jgi:hypothetical protein